MLIHGWILAFYKCAKQKHKYSYMRTISGAHYPLTVDVAFIKWGTCIRYHGLCIVAKTGGFQLFFLSRDRDWSTCVWGYSIYRKKKIVICYLKSLSSANDLSQLVPRWAADIFASSHNHSTTTNTWHKSYTTPRAVLDISDMELW